ncbi:DegV family protein [Acetobacterium wieringae]|uniref:DegV family protein n=1 Tax=Acetobacterium wieringae TaxID=52694 RepID=A0ABY6HG07_9FIRM|nr:DegV family protein [Acetobacterium wieringae]UYO63487.1 DegV family protein [Acetobacterium wieringae]VUZ26187.1 DegV domain-containing protein [Acetobacterium wieringae]
MIRLLVDSMCDLPKVFVNHPNLDMVSLNVIIEGVAYRDKREIDLDGMNKFMARGIVPTTSQVNPGDFLEYFEDCAKNNVECLYLAFTSKLSGSYETSRLILKEVKEKYPDFSCQIVDSLHSGGSIGLIAVELLKLIDQGKDLDYLAAAAKKIIPHAHFYFSIEDLNWLYMGGRVSKGTAVVGGFLKIHPIVSVEEGELKIIGKSRGPKKAQKTIIDKTAENIAGYLDQHVGIAFNGSMKPVEEYDAALRLMGVKHIEPVPIGCVLAAHLGLQGTGIYFFDTAPETILEQTKNN